jgi:DNA-directed RNA polymerase II subunit RPB2
MTETIIWPIIQSYFQSFNMNESKLQSFNKWISEGWPTVIKNHSPLVVKYTHDYHIFDFEGVTMNKPIMTETDGSSHLLFPKETRLRQETYGSDIFFHIRHRVYQLPKDEVVSADIAMKTGELIHDKFTPYVKTMKYPILLKSISCHLSDGSQNYGECNSDMGGYFIIDGGEKMLMYRERLAYNKIFLHPKKDGSTSHFAEFRSEYFDQFRSTQTLNLELSRTTKTESASLYIQGIPWVTFIRALGITKAKDIYTIFRFVARDRWNSTYKNLFKNSLKNNQGIVTRQAALARLGSLAAPSGEKSVAALEEFGLSYIHNKFLPNMGFRDRDDINKVFALCDMGCKLFDYVQDSSLRTNKDSYMNKRSESCEDLLGNLSRQYLVSYLTAIKLNVLKKLKDNKSIDVHEIFGDDKVGKGVKESLASGMWHATKNKVTQTGVSQKLDRANFVCTQAQQMKVINQLRKEVKQIAPRLLSSTSYGAVCPSDSPEGATCGLVKFNSILQHQSIGTDGHAIIHLLLNTLHVVALDKLRVEDMRSAVRNKASFVMVNVNGTPIGVHDDPIVVAQFVRECRRKLSISADTGVSFTKLQVDIRTDRGRNLRPLFVAENLHKLNPNNKHGLSLENLKWTTLLAEGVVENIDKEEEQNLLFATDLKNYFKLNGKGATSGAPVPWENEGAQWNPYNPETLAPIYYTHVEIHGSVFYGVSASLIPFPDHNQSPRNTYQCAMVRQAQGIPSSNAKKHRMDPSFMEMWYAQRPLVETQVHKILNCQKFPYGQNVLVAVCSAGEYGQEDASISNQAAIDFGMLRSSVFRTTPISEKKQGKSDNSEEFRKVDENNLAGRKKANYSHIEEDGLPAIASPVEPGTVLAQKAIRQKDALISKDCPLEWKDMSVTSLNNESGRIDRISITSTACGTKTVKIRVVRVATTKEGDKFATRYGQKGVDGENKAAVDMMYTEDGIMPHFIINSLAFSSRMTWGEWLETLFATVCVVNGRFGDATPFSRQYRDALYKTLEERYAHIPPCASADGTEGEDNGHIVDEISDALAYLGLDCNGEHVMYSGTTGKKFKGRIFMGLTYLQKLKHMVKDKIRARGRGRVQALVRQAVEGRTLNGGLKFAEMERDCLSSGGCAFNIQDRMCFSSDPQYLHICTICNNTVIFDEQCDKIWCQFCDKYDTAVVVLSNSSFKLFQQELIAANINIKLDVEEI